MGTVIIGLIGGVLYQLTSMLLRKAKVDDAVDAFPLQGACGIWGVIALGLFGNPDEGLGGNGVFYGGNQLGVQLFCLAMIILWVGFFSVAIFLPLKMMNLLRLSDDFQDKGADQMEHSPAKAYSQEEVPAKAYSQEEHSPAEV